jgi:CBS domain-containing protein
MKKTVAEFMIVDPISIEKNANIKTLSKIFNVQGISHIPVVNKGKLIGIISKTDLVNKFFRLLEHSSGKNYTNLVLEHELVDDLMTEFPVTAYEDDGIEYVIELLLQGTFHSVPVVDKDNFLKGIITSYDVLKALYSDKIRQDYAIDTFD